jgi:PleD family two-component response regulator
MTGLANRALFRQLERAVRRQAAQDRAGGALCRSRRQEVNDALGHRGRCLLRIVATRLKSASARSTPWRLGGDSSP